MKRHAEIQLAVLTGARRGWAMENTQDVFEVAVKNHNSIVAGVANPDLLAVVHAQANRGVKCKPLRHSSVEISFMENCRAVMADVGEAGCGFGIHNLVSRFNLNKVGGEISRQSPARGELLKTIGIMLDEQRGFAGCR